MVKTVRNEKDIERLIAVGIENAKLEIAKAVTNRAKDLAPVETGLLKANIQFKIEGDKVIVFVPESVVPYAAAMEYGTASYWAGEPDSPRKHDTYQRTGKGSEVGYSPYLRSAVYQLENEFAKIVQAEIVKALS